MSQNLHSKYAEQARKIYESIVALSRSGRQNTPLCQSAIKQFTEVAFLAGCYKDTPNNEVTPLGIWYILQRTFPMLIKSVIPMYSEGVLEIQLYPIQEIHTSCNTPIALHTCMPALPAYVGTPCNCTLSNVNTSLAACYERFPNLRSMLRYNESYVSMSSSFVSEGFGSDVHTAFNLTGWYVTVKIPFAAISQRGGAITKTDIDVLIRWIQYNFTNSKGSSSYLPAYAPNSDKADFSTLRQFGACVIKDNQGSNIVTPVVNFYPAVADAISNSWDDIRVTNEWINYLTLVQ